MLQPNDYRGKPLNGRQGRPFERWDTESYTVIEPLAEMFTEAGVPNIGIVGSDITGVDNRK